ncbi:GNAT family N-acetyltransferase [Streptomyces sp. NRRL WC-3549]|uniref:GNAT family N-acetyltransferase n=1 Tax=Streptomyces sp. NRRL WC-3549 TaxID=1463925 RepID=UPI000AFBFD5C
MDDRIAHGGLVLWEDGGVPVSMAGVSRTVAGTARVSVVYTPPEHRGRGYAAAVTAGAGRTAREAGAGEVLLFADLANPTSNGVYLRIGDRAGTAGRGGVSHRHGTNDP